MSSKSVVPHPTRQAQASLRPVAVDGVSRHRHHIVMRNVRGLGCQCFLDLGAEPGIIRRGRFAGCELELDGGLINHFAMLLSEVCNAKVEWFDDHKKQERSFAFYDRTFTVLRLPEKPVTRGDDCRTTGCQCAPSGLDRYACSGVCKTCFSSAWVERILGGPQRIFCSPSCRGGIGD